VRASFCRTSRFVKPYGACSPARSTSKSMRSLRDKGLNALAVLPSVVEALVVNASRSRTAGVGSCTAQGLQIPDIALGRDLSISEQQGRCRA
jgi:hypothetical protein